MTHIEIKPGSRANARLFLGGFGIGMAIDAIDAIAEGENVLEICGIELKDLQKYIKSYALVNAWGGYKDCQLSVMRAQNSQMQSMRHRWIDNFDVDVEVMQKALIDIEFLRPTTIKIVARPNSFLSKYIKEGQTIDVDGWTVQGLPYVYSKHPNNKGFQVVIPSHVYKPYFLVPIYMWKATRSLQ